ncbi:hypothetical protein [Thermogutta sp.]|uniref:hypothetical protein n=1 Tax=Thermogutta sp. TaxID=1962930 RepID=UPI00321FBD99
MDGVKFQLFQRTVQSLATCTSLTLQVGEVEIRADGLCSPLRSHQRIEFRKAPSPLPSGLVLVLGTRYGLVIQGRCFVPEDFEPPRRPVGPFQGQWIRTETPTFLLQPLLERISAFLGSAMPDFHPITPVQVLGPVLAGYHFRQPVFLLAGEDNRAFKIDDLTPMIRQGRLDLIPPVAILRQFTWSGGETFFNHILLPPGREASESPRAAAPVAVDYRDRIVCAVCCRGPARIVARDHEPVDIPEGEWVALHPFPTFGAD